MDILIYLKALGTVIIFFLDISEKFNTNIGH